MSKEADIERRIHTMPAIAKSTYVDAMSSVTGDVHIGERCGIFPMVVIRGDEDRITIGDETNVQDGAVIHTDAGLACIIGNGVTIGHRAIIHGCSIGDNSLIGMGAIVMNSARIGKNCIIGAGALVTQGTEIPDGMMAFGSPAKIRRPLTPEEIKANQDNARTYVMIAEAHRSID